MSSPVEMTRTPPIVTLGDGIIIEKVARRGSGLDVELSVAHDAPLGAHPIEVDEGDRLLTGASLEVRDTPKVPERSCSSVPNTITHWWVLLLHLFAVTRGGDRPRAQPSRPN